MHNIHLRFSVSADPKQFDRGAAVGSVVMEAIRGFLSAIPGVVVSSASWGLTEREADLLELRELKQRVRALQQQVEDTRELQELRHTVHKLMERIHSLEPVASPVAEVEVVEEPAPEEPTEQPEESVEQHEEELAEQPEAAKPERPRKRVR